MGTDKEWNALPASMFSDQYNLDVFKTRVIRLLLARHALWPNRDLTPCAIAVKQVLSNGIVLFSKVTGSWGSDIQTVTPKFK